MSGIEAAFFGVLGRDAEAKTSKTGKPYLRLNVRVGDGDGDGAQWISVMCFDERAVNVADKMIKSARIYVEAGSSSPNGTHKVVTNRPRQANARTRRGHRQT